MACNRILKLLVAGGCILAAAAGHVFAKERHFEEVRVVLISRFATCTSCHVDASGKELNLYGKGLQSFPKGMGLGERILRMEADPKVAGGEDDRRYQMARQDVDGDGVRNWIEILAGKNPADPGSKPPKKVVERIERVVSCSICHSATNLPGKEEGLQANPHNELGTLLARTIPRPRPGEKTTRSDREIRDAAERTSVLTRLALIKNKRPRGSKATFWQRLRMLFPPAETSKGPSVEALKAFKKDAALQRSARKRDVTRGLDCSAHPVDGFLLDARVLD